MFKSGAEKQESLRGRGKVLTLATKKHGINKSKSKTKSRGNVNASSSASAPTTKVAADNARQIINNGRVSMSMPRPRIISGLSTGLMLGLAAGIAQITLTKLEELLQPHANVNASTSDSLNGNVSSNADVPVMVMPTGDAGKIQGIVWTVEQEEELDAKVKAMSSEEIQREIDALKNRFDSKK